jgi:2-(1,2-epoxy-1,2-dihydrophenyl)acetyl-CoA isomerase
MSDIQAPLLFERDGAIARLTLNRPTAGNAIDMELGRALMAAAIACDEDAGIRCVVLTGAGRLFCAGGDIGAFSQAGAGLPALLKELTGYLHMAVSRLARMGKPLICAVNGPAAGAGLSLAVLGDMVLAARSAHFTVAYTGIGLTPDGGSSWLLPRLVGHRRAQELMLTNRRVASQEAADIGLVTRMVEDADLAAETSALAQQLCVGATQALGRTRGLLLSGLTATLETQMEAEARAIADSARGPEGHEGVAAFIQKRKPDFGGS